MTDKTDIIRALILGLAIAGTAMSQPSFTITQLPSTLHPNDAIVWVGVNGQMLGDTTDPATGIIQCAKYQNGVWTVFSTPGYSCYVYSANKSGQFVGALMPPVNADGTVYSYPFANLDGTFFVPQPPGVTYAPSSGANTSIGSAYSINDSGVVVGEVWSATGSEPAQFAGWIYSGVLQYRMLNSANIPYAYGYAINDSGVVAGAATFGSTGSPTAMHPAIFSTNGSVQDLGTFGGDEGWAYAVNSSGEVTGCAENTTTYTLFYGVTQGCQAFLYDGTTMQQIPVPGTNYLSQGTWIDDAGDVLGNYYKQFNNWGNPDGFFYYSKGVLYWLDGAIIPNLPAGATVVGARFLNGINQILAELLLSDQTTAWYLLTPAVNNAPPAITAVVNGASFAAPISGASWITIEGGNLSTTTRPWNSTDFVGNNLPTQLDGVSVTVNGVSAYPCYISPTQLNVLAPDGVVPDGDSAGQVQVQVMNLQGTSSVFTTNAIAAAPAFFVFGTKYVAAEHANGVPIGPAAFGGNFTPAQPGETIELYATGFGPMNPFSPAGQILAAPAPLANADTVTVTVGGQPAVVTYAGVVSNGLDQLNVTVPPGLPNGDALVVAATSNGFGPIYITQAGLAITVQQ
jgi:uncharacterized protein (TIGR03437 family)